MQKYPPYQIHLIVIILLLGKKISQQYSTRKLREFSFNRNFILDIIQVNVSKSYVPIYRNQELICSANQMNGFYMARTLILNGLILQWLAVDQKWSMGGLPLKGGRFRAGEGIWLIHILGAKVYDPQRDMHLDLSDSLVLR